MSWPICDNSCGKGCDGSICWAIREGNARSAARQARYAAVKLKTPVEELEKKADTSLMDLLERVQEVCDSPLSSLDELGSSLDQAFAENRALFPEKE